MIPHDTQRQRHLLHRHPRLCLHQCHSDVQDRVSIIARTSNFVVGVVVVVVVAVVAVVVVVVVAVVVVVVVVVVVFKYVICLVF